MESDGTGTLATALREPGLVSLVRYRDALPDLERALREKGVSERLAGHVCRVLRIGMSNEVEWRHIDDYDLDSVKEIVFARCGLRFDIIDAVVDALATAIAGAVPAASPAEETPVPTESPAVPEPAAVEETVVEEEISLEPGLPGLPERWEGFETICWSISGDILYLRGSEVPARFCERSPVNDRHVDTVIILDGAKAIGDEAFRCHRDIVMVHIPATVKTLGDRAFHCCEGMTQVDFGDRSRLESVGENCFSGCTCLGAIRLPYRTVSVGYGAFQSCTSLREVDLPEELGTIGPRAFHRCTSLESIRIPSKIDLIREETFSQCTSLVTVDFGHPSPSFREHAFYECGRLHHPRIPRDIIERYDPSKSPKGGIRRGLGLGTRRPARR
ncbi:MAG: leucine-rich repeat domain-containing protein [archaeon]|nr:leucine-rich repeat domain-containing protein [archaeon]